MERKITIEEEEIYQEDYQMRMLQANHIEGFLTVKGRGADGKSYYDYDVSGKTSVKALYEKNEMNGEDIRRFLQRLVFVLGETRKYLLDIHHILLNPEYIYYEEGEYYFCYYPPGGKNLWEDFHTLTEYFVKRADYKDSACVQMVFLLHKETMEENYSLEKLVTQCLRQEEELSGTDGDEQDSMRTAEEEEENGIKGIEGIEYDKTEHDWITEQELGSRVMRETDNMWTPVKRFLNRHKKPKWGDWDGLYIEEEEL